MEEERVREEIAKQAFESYWETSEWKLATDMTKEHWRMVADQILAIKLGGRALKEWIELYEKGKLRIEADDQSRPQAEGFGYDEHWEGYDLCEELMRKAGFVKVRPKKE